MVMLSRVLRLLLTVNFFSFLILFLVKTCAFFAKGNLGDIARGMVQSAMNRRRNPLRTNDRKAMESFWLDFGHLFKGVSAYLTYAPSRVIVIDSITTRLVSEIRFLYLF